MAKIQIIIGSVRPTRIGDQIAGWVMDIVRELGGFSFEVVDLKDWHLPLDDEPNQPKHGGYLQSHTKAWSEKIAEGDGYVFLTPQYNWGYPASLKNALDHLYYEWDQKPAVIVSYGHRGGVKAAAQLREVLTGLHMLPVAGDTNLFLRDGVLDADHRLADPASTFAESGPVLLKCIADMQFQPPAH